MKFFDWFAMALYKILISDKVDEACVSKLTSAGLAVTYQPGMHQEELIVAIADYHGLIVRSSTKVTVQVLEQAKNLKAIGRAGSGVDNIDVYAASEKRIAVFNSMGGNTLSVAEHVFALMLALARKVPQSHLSLQQGKWQRNRFQGHELYAKTLGIIGLGKIGIEVARRAKAFGMTILAYDPLIENEVFHTIGAESVDLETLLVRSEFVSLHVPLNSQTKNLISDAEFEICNRQLRLINAARGGIVNEQALYRALTGGKIAGAALDVFENEPPGENPLLDLDNVVVTPHLGASTAEGQRRVAEEIAERVANFLLYKRVENIVNPEAVLH